MGQDLAVSQREDRGPRAPGSLVTFFLTTYFVTWSCWFATWGLFGADATSGMPRPGFGMVIFLLGVFAPGIVAVGLTARSEGRAAVGALFRRLVQADVGFRWYLFALTYTAGIKLVAALAHRLATGSWPLFGAQPWYILLGATLLSTVVFGQAGEEVGWRGYALPRLAARLGLGPASVLLGVLWAAWHLPLFFLPGTDTTGQSFPLYLLQVTAMSVALAWLYAKTNGSLLLTMLLHAAVNNTKDIVPSAVPGATNPFALSTSLLAWITVGLLWLCAAFFLARMPKLKLPELEPLA